jgi:hypothetical protein
MATPRAVNRSRGPSRGNGLYIGGVLNLAVTVEQHLLDGPEEEQHREDEEGGEDRCHVKAETDSHPDRGHDPDRGGCGEAVYLVALAEDGAGAEETDSSNDLGGDSRWVRGAAKCLEPQPREQARADTHESQGFDSRRMAVELPLETDRDCEYCGDE